MTQTDNVMAERSLSKLTADLQTLCHSGMSLHEVCVLDKTGHKIQERRIESIKVAPNAKVWIVLENENGKYQSDNEN